MCTHDVGPSYLSCGTSGDRPFLGGKEDKMLNEGTKGFMPYLLAALAGMKSYSQPLSLPQLSNNPGERFTGRSKTFRKNLRVVQKAQRRRAFYRSLRSKKI